MSKCEVCNGSGMICTNFQKGCHDAPYLCNEHDQCEEYASHMCEECNGNGEQPEEKRFLITGDVIMTSPDGITEFNLTTGEIKINHPKKEMIKAFYSGEYDNMTVKEFRETFPKQEEI